MSILGSSLDEDWSAKEEPIAEVYLIMREMKVIGVYTPTVFKANEYMFSANPKLTVRRIALNTATIKDLMMLSCKGREKLS